MKKTNIFFNIRNKQIKRKSEVSDIMDFFIYCHVIFCFVPLDPCEGWAAGLGEGEKRQLRGVVSWHRDGHRGHVRESWHKPAVPRRVDWEIHEGRARLRQPEQG